MPEILNTTEFTELTRNERQIAENATALSEGRDPASIGFSNLELARRIIAQGTSGSTDGTDWLEEAKADDVTIQNYQFDVGGGSRLTKYYFSGQYIQDEGLVKGMDYKALNLQARFNTKLNDKVKLGVNFRPSYSRQQRTALDFSNFSRNYNFFAPYHNEFSSNLTGQPVGSYAHPRHFTNLDLSYVKHYNKSL